MIIPAHNEADNIGRVLAVAQKIKEIDEIIVIADACTDDTFRVAYGFGVDVYNKETTLGKGDAMIFGFNKSRGEIIMFADADLENLTSDHLRKVLNPVLKEGYDLSIGLRDRIFGLGAIIPKIYPTYAIGGERAMKRDFFLKVIKNDYSHDFGIETVMNYYAKKMNLKVATPILKNLHQVIKEKKWGFWQGLNSRFDLMRQVLRARKAMKKITEL